MLDIKEMKRSGGYRIVKTTRVELMMLWKLRTFP
jgi:hypothetical protein